MLQLPLRAHNGIFIYKQLEIWINITKLLFHRNFYEISYAKFIIRNDSLVH